MDYRLREFNGASRATPSSSTWALRPLLRLGGLLTYQPLAGTISWGAGQSQIINDSGVVVGCIANSNNPATVTMPRFGKTGPSPT